MEFMSKTLLLLGHKKLLLKGYKGAVCLHENQKKKKFDHHVLHPSISYTTNSV